MLIVTLTEEEKARIFSKISIDPETGCWNWTGALNWRGYGVVRYKVSAVAAHRLLYAYFKEPIPNGIGPNIPNIDHLCNNKKCCNPDHLKLVMPRENVLRGNGPTAINSRKVFCKNGHLLPDKPNRNDGTRVCTICEEEKRHTDEHRKYQREWARKKLERAKG